MRRWEDRRAFFADEAGRDLEAGLDVRPCLVAMSREERLFVAFLRAYEREDALDALIELLALAAPLGADRLALSRSGRAWSLLDPVPPGVPGSQDLRQRVRVLVEVDDSRGASVTCGVVVPFHLEDGSVRWEAPMVVEESTSAVAAALALAVEGRGELAASDREIRRQARRCVRLGHLLGFAEPVFERLAL